MSLLPPSQLAPFVTLSRDLVADCRVFKVERVRRRSGLNGQAHDFFHIDAAHWVNIVAVTPEDEMILVRQERHGVEGFTVEVPAGMIDEGEDPAEAAVRELREETGFTGSHAELLGWVNPNPALQDNRCYTYLIRNATLAGAQQLDEREEIEVLTVPRAKMRELVRRGEITHALALTALFLYELKSGA